MILGIDACSLDKTTHTLYKGKIANSKKVTILVSEIGGLKYVHIYYFSNDDKRYDYWIYFNMPSPDRTTIKYKVERNTFIGRKYIYTSYASEKGCIADAAKKCIKILPEEYEILRFVSQNLKEYNYKNQFDESSINDIKYWIQEP